MKAIFLAGAAAAALTLGLFAGQGSRALAASGLFTADAPADLSAATKKAKSRKAAKTRKAKRASTKRSRSATRRRGSGASPAGTGGGAGGEGGSGGASESQSGMPRGNPSAPTAPGR